MSGQAMLLEGITVVDRGQGMPTGLIAKFLAEQGATVVREFEQSAEPFAQVYRADAVWRNRQQRVAGRAAGVTVDEELLSRADICLLGGEDLPGVPRSGAARALSERFPRLIALEISAYPDGFHYQGPAVDILVQAISGLAAEHYADRPIMMAFKPTLYGAALLGLAGLLAALVERQASGRGQAVFTSLFEGALAWCSLLWFDVESPTPATDLAVPKSVRPLIFRCSDDRYIHVAFFTPGARGATYRVLNIDDPVAANVSGFPKAGADPAKFFGDIDRIAEHVAQRDSRELLAALREAGVAADLVLRAGECWDNPQVAANDLIVAKDGVDHVGNPLQLHIGAGTGAAPSPLPTRTALGNIKILDLGTFVAGPFASVVLGDLGAEVIKVESISGDPARAVFRSDASANRGKRNIKIDLKSPQGIEILTRLCARANLVMYNFRVGVAERLGVDAKALQSRFPGLCVLDSTAYGAQGPRALEPGFDMMIQAWSGHEFRAGGSGNVPLWSRTTMVDYGTGLLGTVAGLLCLYHRGRTGEGVVAGTSLLAGGLYLLSELVRTANGTFEGAPPLNESQTGILAAESFYQVRDGWIAIAVRDDAGAKRLSQALDLPGGVSRSLAAWGSAEQKALTTAFATMSQAEALRLLTKLDVWAAPWLANQESVMLKDRFLNEAGIVHRARYPDVGMVGQVGKLIRFSRSMTRAPGHAPTPGQHTRDILTELGYDNAAIETLYAQRIVA